MSTMVMILIIPYVFVVLFCIGSCIFVYYNRKKLIVSLGQPVYLYQLCIAGILLVSPLIFNAFLTSDNVSTRTNVYFNTNGTISNCIDVEGVFLNTTHDDEGTSSVVLYNNSNNETLGTFDNTGIISSRQQMTYDVGCNFVVIVAWIGIVLTNTVLFAKTYRVYKVTLFRRNQTVKPRNVLGPYIMLVFFSATVLIALTVTSPIHYSTNVYIPLDIFCQCTGTKTLNIAMFTIDIIISLGILVLAWKVRNTNEEISESRKIFILIILGVVLDIAIVVDFALIPEIEDAQINPFLTHSIFAIILILKSLLPIWFLICPRMYYVWYEYKHGHLPESVILPGIGRVHVAGTN